MAVTVRGGTPAITVGTGNPISATVDGDRQPQAGDLLLIFHGNDFYGLANMPTPTVGGTTTGVTAVTTADAGSNSAHVKAYTYQVSSTEDLTVSVTETGSGDEDKVLVVYVLSGANLDDPVDDAAGAASASAQTSQPAPSVTPDSEDALLVVHNNSGGGASTASYTPPASPYTELYDGRAGGISYTGGVEQLSASGATGTRTITAATSVPWAAITVAIRAAGAGAAEGVLAATLPALTGQAEGAASTDAAVAGTLPTLIGAVAVDASAGAQLAGTLPALTGSLSATESATATLTGTLPALTGSFAEVQPLGAAPATVTSTPVGWHTTSTRTGYHTTSTTGRHG
ncbi:MAG TPA: hypothetical protein VF174_14525 [Micromonosporaceae bacterium]